MAEEETAKDLKTIDSIWDVRLKSEENEREFLVQWSEDQTMTWETEDYLISMHNALDKIMGFLASEKNKHSGAPAEEEVLEEDEVEDQEPATVETPHTGEEGKLKVKPDEWIDAVVDMIEHEDVRFRVVGFGRLICFGVGYQRVYCESGET
jgi:hypothetical protein